MDGLLINCKHHWITLCWLNRFQGWFLSIGESWVSGGCLVSEWTSPMPIQSAGVSGEHIRPRVQPTCILWWSWRPPRGAVPGREAPATAVSPTPRQAATSTPASRSAGIISFQKECGWDWAWQSWLSGSSDGPITSAHRSILLLRPAVDSAHYDLTVSAVITSHSHSHSLTAM